ncbi:MAG: hemerythrin family protein [Candidatus Thiodiazotropha sp. (ex Lucinoma annulata)]|nr:hemerythrin family protein [Candidatus Thiodiazotropha sp. (ex Lucinoma borealis)]MCU7839398.1 hemerythrin family protein [Candidatus Thiodiazotropha sp. (ex Troendleina suluensis)]MCU7883216.1 hemerythrin family protein [Candidatus Thiodiazotropha sp. (ex Lucinoma annulata)]MCU7946294.1 hemerythrin family protein [Candidatus Thiodiazotropha sp. (ex Cardiolucina cf. quadrata)]MCU7856030.1 hemerythrin family protein [Candidatus Thiodiazotropha sp. (ex Lucinoma borealis)]
MSKKRIDWVAEYELGINDIDFQHHYFLDLINRLSDELGRVDNITYQSALISELNAYARFHFISEENIMGRAGYPMLDEHKRYHLELIDQLTSKEARLQMDRSEIRAKDIIDFLVEWFLKHTTHEDRLFSDYLQNKG